MQVTFWPDNNQVNYTALLSCTARGNDCAMIVAKRLSSAYGFTHPLSPILVRAKKELAVGCPEGRVDRLV